MTGLSQAVSRAKRARGTVQRMTKARARAISLTLRETASHALLAIPELPPSANVLFATIGRRRVKTSLYKAWLAAGIQDLRIIQRAPLVKGRIQVTIVAERRLTFRDLDNIAKPTLDLLVKAEVIEDDYLVERLTLQWSDTVKGVQIAVGQA